MDQFVYSPLSDPDEIRVLALSPGHCGRDLEGSMQHIRLSTKSSPSPTNIQTFQPVQLTEHDILHQATTFPYATQLTPSNGWTGYPQAVHLLGRGSQQQTPKLPYPTNPSPSNVWEWHHLTSREVGVFRFDCTRRGYYLQEYDALSYTWGNPSRTKTIVANGKLLGIAQNLYTALVRLRSANQPRILWIDAICIDQDNVQERNHQVQMMRRIFSAASSVIIWLGDPQKSLDSTLEMVLDYNRRAVPKTIFKYREEPLNGLSNLFRRHWWKRIWIVQEVVAARELVILLGRTIFPWSFLANICWGIQRDEFRQHRLAPVLRSCGYQKFVALDNFRQCESMTLVGLLRSTQDYQASDPRDKLYALLGMASDVSTEDIVPDYTKPVQNVYEDVVKFMAVQRQSLDILSSGRLYSSDQAEPSWLPHWQLTSVLQPLSGNSSSYQAAGNTTAVVDMSQFPLTLAVEGILADKVELPDGSIMLTHEYLSTIRKRQSISAGSVDYKTFRQFIVTNKDHAGNQASPSLKQEFEWYINSTSRFNSRATKDFSDPITTAVMGRRFFTTKQEDMGLAPAGIQIGDRVAIVKGCHVPLILRPVESYWVLVGEAYVFGMMDGEVISGLQQGRYKTRMIQLR